MQRNGCLKWQQLIDSNRPAGVFQSIEEDTFQGGGNAWLVGRYRKIEQLIEGIQQLIEQSSHYQAGNRSGK
jgi:alpha-mannosidase